MPDGPSDGDKGPSGSPGPRELLLCCRFLLNHDFQVRGHVLVELNWDREFAQGLQWLVQLNLAAIDVEAFLAQPIGQIARRYGSKELIVFAGLAGKRDRHAFE